MKTLEFKVDIKASAKKVWDTMLTPESYKEWVHVSWPNSFYVGTWDEGKDVKFLSSSGEGTLATLTKVKPYELLEAKHVAVLLKDGSEDRESKVAEGWVGTTETYRFSEKNGNTELKITIKTSPDWEQMFSEGWPNALKKLKEMSEN